MSKNIKSSSELRAISNELVYLMKNSTMPASQEQCAEFSSLIDEFGINNMLRNDYLHKNCALLLSTIYSAPLEFLHILIEKKADFTIRDLVPYYKNTPLVWSIANANNSFAAALLDSKVNVGIDEICQGNTALHLAIAKGYTHKDAVGNILTISNTDLVRKIIIIHDADPNIKVAKTDYTALDLAVARRNIEMVSNICLSKKLSVEIIQNTLKNLQSVREQNEEMENSRKILSACYKGEDTREKLSKENFCAEITEEIGRILWEKVQEIENPSHTAHAVTSGPLNSGVSRQYESLV